MAKTKTERAPRTVRYSQDIGQDGKIEVATYQYTLPSGKRAGEVLDLLEISTTKKKWSDEIHAYYDRVNTVTLTPEQFQAIVSYFSRPAAA
ncbi:MAG TPA: hypothetical protein PK765_01555 [bacterium]|nr:hypothetical protein [bacterium]